VGFVRKITGVQGQIDAANRAADMEAQAAMKAAQDSANATIAQAQSVATQQAADIARQKAVSEASATLAEPVAKAEVQLDSTSTVSTAAATRKRKGQFGKNYVDSVQI
jgi:translation elongation factor EF-G